MEVQPLRPGLWRWRAPHLDWRPEKDKPGGWGQMVGCVYYEPPRESADATVLFDPLAPPAGTPDAARFWEALDRDVNRTGLPVAVLLGNYFHERSAQAVYDRYREQPGAAVWASEAARGRVTCPLTRTFRAGDPLPGGVQGFAIQGLEKSETAYYLPPHRALVFADAVIGTGGGTVRVAPVSWAEAAPEGQALYGEKFRASLRVLVDLPVEMLLVSHGDPVLEDGHRALVAALEAPAWGEE